MSCIQLGGSLVVQACCTATHKQFLKNSDKFPATRTRNFYLSKRASAGKGFESFPKSYLALDCELALGQGIQSISFVRMLFPLSSFLESQLLIKTTTFTKIQLQNLGVLAAEAKENIRTTAK